MRSWSWRKREKARRSATRRRLVLLRSCSCCPPCTRSSRRQSLRRALAQKARESPRCSRRAQARSLRSPPRRASRGTTPASSVRSRPRSGRRPARGKMWRRMRIKRAMRSRRVKYARSVYACGWTLTGCVVWAGARAPRAGRRRAAGHASCPRGVGESGLAGSAGAGAYMCVCCMGDRSQGQARELARHLTPAIAPLREKLAPRAPPATEVKKK
jgi:hypothetical protein